VRAMTPATPTTTMAAIADRASASTLQAVVGGATLPSVGRPCAALNARGEPCRSTSVGASGLCACHDGKARFGTVEFSRRGGLRSASARRERAEIRKRSALDWAAYIVEQNGRELAESFLNAARNGDWRAADALMSRIYGKPEAAVVSQIPSNPATDVIRSLSLSEKLELLHRLRQGEAVALPVVGPAPPTG
jgi:hypothetical protein